MGMVTEDSVTLGEASEYPIDTLREILADLRPYVWVVGSYANDCPRDVSDIDLMPKRKPYEVYEADIDKNDDKAQEYYYKEIRDVLAKWGLKNLRSADDETWFSWNVFWHRYLDIYEFTVPLDAKKVTKFIPYVGVEMDCLEYDRSIDPETIEYAFGWDWEDWEFE